VALPVYEPCRIDLDTGRVADRRLPGAAAPGAAFDVGQALDRGAEKLFLLLAMGAPVGAVKLGPCFV